MTRRKNWLVKINKTMKNNMKLVDNSTLAIKEIGDASIKINNCEPYLSTYALYILGNKCNFVRIIQYLETITRFTWNTSCLKF